MRTLDNLVDVFEVPNLLDKLRSLGSGAGSQAGLPSKVKAPSSRHTGLASQSKPPELKRAPKATRSPTKPIAKRDSKKPADEKEPDKTLKKRITSPDPS